MDNANLAGIFDLQISICWHHFDFCFDKFSGCAGLDSWQGQTARKIYDRQNKLDNAYEGHGAAEKQLDTHRRCRTFAVGTRGRNDYLSAQHSGITFAKADCIWPNHTYQPNQGTVVVDVLTRNYRHTTVETPFLAAVVKGTSFEVKVRELKASLRVIRGKVEVTDQDRGEQIDIIKGQKVDAVWDPSLQMRFTGRGNQPAWRRVAVTKAKVEPTATARAKISATLEQRAQSADAIAAENSSSGGAQNGNVGGNGNSGGNSDGNGNGNGNGGGNGNN